ncbi:MAG: hypothetical protein PVH61_33970 [Candidatus Aminicenantes bacterium]
MLRTCRFFSILFLLFTLLNLFALEASPSKSITIDRVRYKKNWYSWAEHPDYPEWQNRGVSTLYRKYTFIGKYWEPGKTSVRYMIFTFAGQQGSSGLSGLSNCVTGQDETWLINWDTYAMSDTLSIHGSSLTSQLIDYSGFTSSDTFIAAAFDTMFNWGNTIDQKNKQLKAYADWFCKHAYASNVDKIFLYGSSRGAVLACRLAKAIHQKSGWANVDIYVGALDAVPNKLQEEMEVTSVTCDNPTQYDSNYYGYVADIDYYYGSYHPTKLHHTITGDPVFGARCFCAYGLSWYEQYWCDLEHAQLGQCADCAWCPYDPDYMEIGINALYDWTVDIME